MPQPDTNTPQFAPPGTFVAMTFSSGATTLTTYGEVTHADGEKLRIRCLSITDFDDVVTGKALRVRFPFAGQGEPVDAVLAGREEGGVVIQLRGEDRDISRRTLLRGGAVLPIRVFLSAGRFTEGRTVNVSAGGAMVVLSELPPPDAELLFRLALPDEPSAALEGQAKVAWTRRVAGENQVGLTFMALETPEIRRLCRVAFRAAAQGVARS